MYKKIGVILLALILMFNFTFKEYADAAIASKAAGQAAKQVAKEVIQDIAVETAANFALQEAMDIAGKYEAKQGYKVICPTGGSDCSKPIQIKENITETDKQAIKGQAGTELDKLLNGGSGVPKWQKFLDWFLPVWLISFGATALTYAFDSDVRSLFNEAAYNALVSLGFIVPIVTTEAIPLDEVEVKEKDVTEKTVPDGTVVFAVVPISSTYASRQTRKFEFTLQTNYVYDHVFHNQDSITHISTGENSGRVSLKVANLEFDLNGLGHTVDSTSTATLYKNGEYLTHAGQHLTTTKFYLSDYYTKIDTGDTNIDLQKLTSMRTRMPYKIGEFWYTDVLFNTVSGNQYDLQFKTSGYTPRYAEYMKSEAVFTSSQAPSYTVIANPNVEPMKKILPPVYADNSEEIGDMASSNYENDSGNVALIPPTALTYKEESTGETVYRVPAAVPTNPPVFQKEDGTPVPEEEITVDPAPNVTPAPSGTTTEKGEPIPEGTPIVTPAPTPSNPAPAPIPLTPAPTPTPTTPTPEPTTPVEPPTTGDPPTTGEPIPDGPSCEEKFKFPILSPLKETFSTAFPFSIPWDIERAINAAFSGIGHEKPKFNLDLNVLGQKETIEITTPKMFDDWKPFTDTLLVLTFDVLIMFGVYRFVKGAGS